MKTTVRGFLAMTALAAVMAGAAGAALPPEIENPECLGIRKQPYHATLMPYATVEQAVAARRFASPNCRVLNGAWKFH